MKAKSIPFFVALAMLVAVSAGNARAADGHPASDVVDKTPSAVVNAEELEQLRALAEGETEPELGSAPDALWYCVAQSYVTGLWYYWYSYNAYHSRYMALNACVSQNGYTCAVDCRFGW